MKVDLHLHTLYSDGIYEVEEVVNRAAVHGISVLSITDHDTLLGVNRARMACKNRICFISGTEITCSEHIFQGWELPVSIHLLGYGIDEENPALPALFKERDRRVQAAYRELIEELSAMGYEIQLSSVPVSCGNVLQLCDVTAHVHSIYGQVGAKAEQKMAAAAGRLTGANVRLKDGVEAIHQAGGKAVWAHPFCVYQRFEKRMLSEAEISLLLKELVPFGIDGLEADYLDFSDGQRRFLRQLAEEHRLFVTAGSDFHGSKNRDRMGVEVSGLEWGGGM